MFSPRMIIAMANVTKPWVGLSSGQLRAKYCGKTESSETRRNAGQISMCMTLAAQSTYCS